MFTLLFNRSAIIDRVKFKDHLSVDILHPISLEMLLYT